MNGISRSSAVNTPKSRSGNQTTLKRDRQRTIITPRTRPVPTSWNSHPMPTWFLYLRLWQRRFGIATYLLMAGLLAAYGSTVYLQQKWNQEFHKLENLQRHERQLTTTNEIIKNQLAKEAENSATKLIPPDPAMAIILPAASLKSDRPFLKPPSQPPAKIDLPSGY